MKNKQILFLPTYFKPVCEIEVIGKRLSATKGNFWSKKAFSYLIVKEIFPDLSTANISSNVKEPDLNKIIAFAVRDFEWPILLTSKSDKFIDVNWFNYKYDNPLVIFFVSGGANLLKDFSWSQHFKNWISFDGNFDTLEGLSMSKYECEKIFESIFECINNENNAEVLYKKIYNIYEEAIDRILKKYNHSDVLIAVQKLLVTQANLAYGKN